jgi:hypothetical protein
MVRIVRFWVVLKLSLALGLVLPCAASSQAYQPPRHTTAPSPLLVGSGSELELGLRADAGTQIEQDRSPAEELAEHRKLDRALAALGGQRAGTVDAYVVAVALDSDPVFGREARAAAEVLSRRYGAQGRTLILAGSDGRAPSALPRGSPGTLAVALARVAELMDRDEDALILYSTSHGAPFGLYYNDGNNGFGAISPNRLRAMLDGLGVRNRLLILSACYSGVFVPVLRSPSTAIVTAASHDRTSFGCAADNDWTFFGDALINRALRKPQLLPAAFTEAQGLIAGWEARVQHPASQPQIAVGALAARWLEPLERRIPRTATAPVGRPAIETTVPPTPVLGRR